jgi:hypothetical protein
MVSKCANPQCSEIFRYLHQGRIFHLRPSPAVEAAAVGRGPVVNERFWLCDVCAKEMTVTWNGSRAEIVRLPKESLGLAAPPAKGPQRCEDVPALVASAGSQ